MIPDSVPRFKVPASSEAEYTTGIADSGSAQASAADRPVALPPEKGRRDAGKCYQHAEDCARKAAAQIDPQLKRDFTDLEQRWLALARSYDFVARLNDFSKHNDWRYNEG